jgi:hypothetical protein
MENKGIGVIIPYSDTSGVRIIVLNRFKFIFIVLTAFILGCSRELPSDPMCRTSEKIQETSPSPAACLIKSNGKLLAIKSHDDDVWHLPNQKQQNAISAQCTAHKAVWKTTGLNVEVGKLLFTAQNQTQYFACKLTDDYSKQLEEFPVPSWANRSTNHIALIDPFETQQDQWIIDINLIDVRKAYNQLE